MNALDRYTFEDRVSALATIHWANFFLVGLCLFNNLPSIFQHPQFQWALFTAVIFLGVYTRYDWQSRRNNLVILFVYVALLVAELLTTGLPNTGMDAPVSVRKGVMLDIIILGAPIVYALVKLLLLVPLVRISLPIKSSGVKRET